MMNRIKIKKIELYMILIIISISTCLAVPVPLGISGTVYGLDNITRADETIGIAIRNLNSSYYVIGNLRKDGSFSAAVQGDFEDVYEIKLWNADHEAFFNTTIEGVVRGFDLYMNLSIMQPLLPPVVSPSYGSIKRFRRPKVITGLITFKDNPAEPGVDYTITNLETGENVSGKTLNGLNAFADVVYGEEGDDLEIKVGNDNYNEKSLTKITGEITREDVNLGISKWIYGLKQLDIKTIMAYMLLFTLMFVPALIIFRIKK